MLRGIDCDRVTGVDSRSLDVLHDARNQYVVTVVDSVYFDLSSLDVLVDQDRVFDALREDDVHVFLNVIVVESDGHVLTAKDV